MLDYYDVSASQNCSLLLRMTLEVHLHSLLLFYYGWIAGYKRRFSVWGTAEPSLVYIAWGALLQVGHLSVRGVLVELLAMTERLHQTGEFGDRL